MKLSIELPQELRSPITAASPKSFGKINSPENFLSSSDLSSTDVRVRLSSTRQLLEQTLNNKKKSSVPNTSKFSEDPSDTTHNQLKKPDFVQLNHIYENYMKVPNKEKVQYNHTSQKRSTSAPPVFSKTKEQLIQEKELKFKEECTFKPNINKIPQDRNLNYSQRKFDRGEWFKNLTKPKTEVIERRERLKREKEEVDSKNCSFRPLVSSFRSVSSSHLPIEDRLYAAENKGLKREQLKRNNDEKEAMSFPFRPQVSESVAVLMDSRKVKTPLYKRIYEVQQERNHMKQQAKEKSEQEENLTFQPIISPKSRALAANKCLGSVVDRLSRDNSQCKDRPSETSISFTSNSSKAFNTQEFLNRQQEHLLKSKLVKEELINKSTQDLSFKPTINQNSSLIAYFKKNYSEETLESKLKRISDEALSKKNALQQQIREKYYEAFKFEPEINPLSKQLAKTTNLESSQQETRNKRKLLAQASVAELQKICSFSPRINSASRFNGVSSHYKQGAEVSKGIERQRMEKGRVMENGKKEQEIREMSGCTFTPKAYLRIRGEPNVQVKGADRFHEIRAMVRKQEIEKEERERKVLYKDMRRELAYSPI